MIDCATATDLLRTAEPAELHGTGESPLATHVRGCASCGARAKLLLAEQARLAHALDSLAPLHAVTRPAASVRRRLARVLVPLAAAAAAAFVLLWRASGRDEPLPPILVAPTRVADVPIVNAGTARNVAVLRTSDPNITVVWYY